MSKHSYTRCGLHMIWGTLHREKEIYLKISFVNADHVHALTDLPTNLSIEDAFQLIVNENRVCYAYATIHPHFLPHQFIFNFITI